MSRDERIYRKLQKHLNRQAIGFPATRSGVELKILRHIFSPHEARIACHLNYKFETIQAIFQRVKHLFGSIAALEGRLDRIVKKGGLELKLKDGIKHYCCSPLVVGMYEFQLERLTPDFIKDFDAYTSTKNFGIDFLSTKLPQMRTIPVARSIHPQHHVSTFDEVLSLLQHADGPFVIFECICRKKRALGGHSCRVTDRKETCLAIDHLAEMSIANQSGRQISRDEAIVIIEQNQRDGLVLQPSNTKKAEFLCSCCGCCCGILRIHKRLPKPLNYWATNFHAVVDSKTCLGCRNCESICQVGAINLAADEPYAVVDLDRCLGCGVCVSGCPADSISLLKNATETVPPPTREELLEIIMQNKKGRLGKLLLSGSLVYDAVRTGQMNLLKP